MKASACVDIVDQLADILKKRVKGREGIVYADLDGRAFNAQEYCDELDKSESFVREQIFLLLEELSAKIRRDQDNSGISPEYQRKIALQIKGLIDSHHIYKGTTLEYFLISNPLLAVHLCVSDVRKVLETLDIEFNIKLDMPPAEELQKILNMER